MLTGPLWGGSVSITIALLSSNAYAKAKKPFLLRRNSAAHRRVMILVFISISDASFSRFVGLWLL